MKNFYKQKMKQNSHLLQETIQKFNKHEKVLTFTNHQNRQIRTTLRANKYLPELQRQTILSVRKDEQQRDLSHTVII